MTFPGLLKKAAPFFFLLSIISVNGFAADSSLAPIEMSLQNLISRLSQSVVTVEAARSVSQSLPSARGNANIHNLISSGIIYDTASHVIVAASSVVDRDNIFVLNGGKRCRAQLVGIDYQTGLALLKTEHPVGRPVDAIDNYRCIGQLIIAVGNSYGLHASPSLGFCAGARTDGSLQFSAAISSGSIGGGVFDLTGKLIGAITGGIGEGTKAEAGLAIPASELPGIVDYLIKNGNRQAGYMGLTITEIEIVPPIELTNSSFMDSGSHPARRILDNSVVVTQIEPGSPAELAGVMQGDLIIGIDFEDVFSAVDFLYQIRKTQPGAVVRLGLVRQNRMLFSEVEVGRRPNVYTDTQLGSFAGEMVPAIADKQSIYEELQELKKAMKRLEERLDKRQ